ncbi:MAG: VWA domain-containing protein [Chloroflexaceae bacterium]|nr:VWA domain-containing protein [Chloroflexaceae bacterium]NJO04843.1 VWA domain-containing protein [Chloroflexaceae bacterium]
MSLLAPLALIGAAIIGPLIVAMYLLKLRREDRTVSSTFLWRRMVRDVEANAPWQRLRPNWLLFLQLLIMLLLVLALARPFFFTQGIAGRNLVIIIDRSASMGAIDEDTSRLAAAKQQAIQLVDQLPDGGRATIIATGGRMEVPASATADLRELRDAINSIELSIGGSSNLAQALTLASALVSRDEQSEVAIISEGNVTIPADLEVPAPVSYFPIGQRTDNVAISALVLQPGLTGQTLFVQATNYAPEAPAVRRLDVYLDGELFNAYNLTLQPGVEESIVADVPPDVEIVEARLSGDDGLPLDDRAWAVSRLGEATNVRVIGPGNRFLATGLALLPGVSVTTVPTTTTTFEETAAQIPVTILDGVVPPTLPPGNLFFIAPPRSTEFFSVTGLLEFPSVRPAAGEDPLLRNVSLSEVSILEAVRIVPGTWAQVVVDSDGAPLLVAGERDGRRIVVLTFDLLKSDLPLQVAFPLLLSNIINYLAPGSGADAALLLPGEPVTIQIDPEISEVRLTMPDGSQITQASGPLFFEPEQLGVYTLEEYRDDELEARLRYTVNLFAPEESRIVPQDALAVAQTGGIQSAITPRDQEGRQEFWRWLAAVALLVLLIEWLVYQRSGLVALFERLRGRPHDTAGQRPARSR